MLNDYLALARLPRVSINQMAAGLSERDRVKSAFARYVSHQVMTSILNSGKEVSLSGARRQISVLFCDIRGFSSISERLPPEKVVKLLNEYFAAMVDVVLDQQPPAGCLIREGERFEYKVRSSGTATPSG